MSQTGKDGEGTEIHGEASTLSARSAEARRFLARQPSVLAWRYMVAGIVWLAVSDAVFKWLPIGSSFGWAYLASKGFLFVAASAAVIYVLQKRAVRHYLDTRRALDRLGEGYAAFFRSLPVACFVTRAGSGEILEANAAAVAAYGWSATELRGMRLRELEAAPVSGADIRLRRRYGPPRSVLSRHRTRDGRLLDVDLFATTLVLDNGETELVMCFDVTAQARAEEVARMLTGIDALTGLPNRIALQERIDRAIREGSAGGGFAVLFIDIDLFRLVNETRGHAAGDLYLRDVASRLNAFVGAAGAVVRPGGDEFVVFVPNVVSDDACVELATAIRDVVAGQGRLGGLDIACTCSIGIARYPAHAEDADGLLNAAEAAMYRAKRGGRDAAAVFDDSMRRETSRHVELVRGLRHALLEGELHLRFQPQYALTDRSIVGIEALCAWTPADGADVPAGEFIPAAERSGLIVDIGGWVLRESLRQLARWRDAGLYGGRMAVNVSPVQLRGAAFIDFALSVMRECGVDPGAVELEITETAALHLDDELRARLFQLAHTGVAIAIDDFGRGYSSLSHFKQLPVDTIKVDASFVHRIDQSPDSQAIVRSMLLMARALGIRAVAEGVEREAEAEWLLDHGCDIVQGFMFARPMSAAELEKRLREGRALPRPAGAVER